MDKKLKIQLNLKNWKIEKLQRKEKNRFMEAQNDARAEKIRESKTNTHCVNIWQFDEQFCVINKSLLIRFAYYDTKLHY